jgi:hypothetical protein
VSRTEIVVFASGDDLHALSVIDRLNADGAVVAHLVEADRLAFQESLSWSAADGDIPAGSLLTVAGARVDVGSCGAAWWRRVYPRQREADRLQDDGQQDLLNRTCSEALLGVMLTCFPGTWVSDPLRTRTAANKLVQQMAAARAGFRVPRTLISQEPERIRRFCAELDGRVVLKTVTGSPRTPLLTQHVRPEHLELAASLTAMPTIYQELIPGEVHLRVNCFGDDVHAVQIRARELDWRADLDVPMAPVVLSPDLEDRLRSVLRELGLRMGIVDLKVTPDGEPVWLEVNPQGQFLFLQPLVEVDYLGLFARFLIDEARRP